MCQGSAAGYPENHYYVTVDIAPCLHPVENVLAAHLYYQGLLNRVWNSRDGRCGLAADVVFLGRDGTVAGRVEPVWRYGVTDAYGMDATVVRHAVHGALRQPPLGRGVCTFPSV